MRCSVYHTMHKSLEKTACILAEKSYLNDLKVVMLLNDVERQEAVNRLLWTYARLQFIPHGSREDPLPELQPVYLTHIAENPNNASVLILLEPSFINIQNNEKYLIAQKFDRICMIFDLNSTSESTKISELIEKHTYLVESFTQQEDASWTKC